MIHVRAEQNGDYTKLVWFDESGKKHSRNATGGKKLPTREIERQRAELAAELAADPRLAKGTGKIGVREYIERYLGNRTDLRAGSHRGQAASLALFAALFANRRMHEIGAADANDFRLNIERRRVGEGESARPIALATVRLHMRNLRTFFRHAADELEVTGVKANPFRAQAVAVPDSVREWEQVSAATLDKLMEACSLPQWRATFALCRLAGLRSNEARRCLWSWLDSPTAATRILVAMPTDEHGRRIARTTKHRERVVPVSVRLRAILAEVFEQVGDKTTGPTDGIATDPSNLANIADKIRVRAGVPDYGQPLHALRKSCASEWINERRIPLPTVAKWLGDRPEVVAKYYHAVADADFAAMTTEQIGETPGRATAPNQPQSSQAVAESPMISGSERWLSGLKQQT